MRRLRLVILGFGLLVIAFLLISPEADPPDAAGAEATSASLLARWHIPAPVVRQIRKISEFSHYSLAHDSLEMVWDSLGAVDPGFHSSLTLLCLLRC